MIVRTPGVCGGRACIDGTRIGVWLLVVLWRQGHTDEKILELYPSLKAEQLQAAWRYSQENAAEISKDVQECS